MKAGLPSIRRDLLLRLLITALLPLLVVFVLSTVLWLDYLRGNALEDGEHLCANMSAQIRGRLASAEAGAQVIADVLAQLEAKEASTELKTEALDAVVAGSKLFETIYLVGADTKIMAIGLPAFLQARREDFVGSDLSRFSILAKTREAGAPLWSDSHLSLITGRPCLTYCLPFKDGLLVASSTLSTVEDLPAQLADRDDYKSLLLDRKGVVLLDTRGRRPSSVIRLDHEPLVASALTGVRGTGAFNWEGESCLGSSSRIAQTGWVVVSFAPQNVVLRSLHFMLVFSAVGMILGLLLAFLLALAMSRRLARPLALLSEKTSEIAAGEYGAGLEPQPYQELEQVAGSLRHLAQAVKERERRLHELAASMAGSAGGDCFQLVADSCVRLLGADLAFVARISPEDALSVLACHPPGTCASHASLSVTQEPFRSTLGRRMVHMVAGAEPGLFVGCGEEPCFRGYIGVAVYDDQSRPVGLLCAFSREDFVLPAQAEEALRILAFRASVELARLESERRQRATEEELRQAQKMEAMGRLVGGIAHDFNNMLQGIRGFTEMAREDLPPGHRVHEHLTEVHNAGVRATELVQQLLIFSRKDNPRQVLMDLNVVLNSALRMLRRVIGEQILVDFSPCKDPAWILADKTQIDQILMNLAVNARDAMPKGGRLVFALRVLPPQTKTGAASTHQVELAVRDTGHGMSPEVKARVFEPFFTTKGVGKGTGLGLATVYGIMQQSGGSIRVESHVGEGTCFLLSFPLKPEPQSQDTAAAVKPLPALAVAGKQQTILVAEDDAVLRSLIVQVLRAEGFKVLFAVDGGQAIELFDQNEADIVLLVLDVIMPRKNGREVAEHAWRRWPQLPVLFTSGYFTDNMDVASLPAAYSRVLLKPYAKEDLLARLRELLH